MFKIGTTSYICPDKIMPNIEKLKNEVDDIELLLFERDPLKELSAEDLCEMAKISKDFNLSYTVHLPLELDIASGDRAIRDLSVSEICSIIKTVSIIDPYAYILHLKIAPEAAGHNLTNNVTQSAQNSLAQILKLTGVEPAKICIENTNYPLKHIYNIIETLGLSVCLDIGHLIIQKEDIKANLNAYINKIKVIHLCGIDSEGRHLSLKTLPSELCRGIIQDIKTSGFNGVLTLEVFSENEYRESRDILDKEVVI